MTSPRSAERSSLAGLLSETIATLRDVLDRCNELLGENRSLRGVPVPLPVRLYAWPGHPAPAYQSALAAGADAHARLLRDVVLLPGERFVFPLGFAVELPEGWEMQVRPRSGLARSHGIGMVNAPGTIDADYRGEVCANLINLGPDPWIARPGDRIAQVVLAPVARAKLSTGLPMEKTQRGASGFGSTGIR